MPKNREPQPEHDPRHRPLLTHSLKSIIETGATTPEQHAPALASSSTPPARASSRPSSLTRLDQEVVRIFYNGLEGPRRALHGRVSRHHGLVAQEISGARAVHSAG